MWFNKKIRRIMQVFIVCVFVVTLSPKLYAQTATTTVSAGTVNSVGYTLLEPLPCIPGDTPKGVTPCTAGTPITSPDFSTYVQYMFNLLIALAAVSAVFMIVWGGFEYMTSEAPGVKSDGLKKVQNAISGLLLVLSSFLILRTLDPRLVDIPSTLVAPLELKCPTNPSIPLSDKNCKNYVTDFFGQLASEADNYKVNNQQALANIAAAKKIEDGLLLKKSDLEKQLQNAIKNNDQKQIDSINVQIANTTSNLGDNRAKIQTEEAISIFNYTLTSLATNADQNLLSETNKLLLPDGGANVRKSSLDTISGATKTIYDTYKSTYTKINDPQNPQTPQYISNLIASGDDALLKAAQIYAETYTANKPASIPDTQDGVLNILKYKNSFALTDPTKNGQKNELLLNLCKQEVSSISQDPNLCK